MKTWCEWTLLMQMLCILCSAMIAHSHQKPNSMLLSTLRSTRNLMYVVSCNMSGVSMTGLLCDFNK